MRGPIFARMIQLCSFIDEAFAIAASDAQTAPFQPVEGDSTLYRKELVYPGQFIKRKAEDGSVAFNLFVDDLALDHWVKEFERMKAAGVDVPLNLGHVVDDPERRRGTVESLKKEPNPERGTNSLYMYARFRDPEAAKMAATSGVSLYAEPSMIDGKDNKYTYPITHVALTDHPVIPGLQGWQAIAASLVPAGLPQPQEESAMTPMQALAQEMGVEFPEGASDDVVKAAIIEAWNSESPDASAEEIPGDELGDELPMGGEFGDELPMGDEFGDELPADELGLGMMGEDPDASCSAGGQFPASLQASFASTVKAVAAARGTQIDSLVVMRKITPARAKEIKAKFTTPQRVTFALSHGDIGDGFDDLMLSLSLGPDVVPGGEKTPFQLQQNGAGNVSAVEADAERRAAAARKN